MKVFEKKNILEQICDERLKYIAEGKKIDYIELTRSEAVELYDLTLSNIGGCQAHYDLSKIYSVDGSQCFGIDIKVKGL
jgi:hypothetical protein